MKKHNSSRERANKMIMTALIMAGGRGERFWPRSRKNLPKQFLSLTDDGKTMIQLTVERISSLVKLEDIYIATNKDYKELALEQLPGIPEKNILCEPVGRNTAPCIGLGAVHIAKKYDDAFMFVLPSDHLIKFNKMFLRTLQEACEVAGKGKNLPLVLRQIILKRVTGILSLILILWKVRLTGWNVLWKNPALRLQKNIWHLKNIYGIVVCLFGRLVQFYKIYKSLCQIRMQD